MLARVPEHLHHTGDFCERIDTVGGLMRDDWDAEVVDVVRLHELQALGCVRFIDEGSACYQSLPIPLDSCAIKSKRATERNQVVQTGRETYMIVFSFRLCKCSRLVG